MRLLRWLVASMTCTVLFVPNSSAHHAPVEFDLESVIALEGTVVRYDWQNPHVYIYVETEKSDGESIEWAIETQWTAMLIRSGWTSESFSVGDHVTIRASPDRNAQKTHARLLSIESDSVSLTPESSISLATEAARPIASTSSLSGIWHAERASPGVFAQALAEHPLTEKGAIARANYDFLTDNPQVDCVPFTSPFWVRAARWYLSEIEVQEDRVFIRSEFFDSERTIYTDGRGHPDNGERTNQGHSIGRWENGVLVVDTTLFEDNRSAYNTGIGIPSGSQKHVIERYALSEDGTHLVVDVFLEDPEYLAEPFIGNVVWNYVPHLEMLQVDCDPEVARRYTLQ